MDQKNEPVDFRKTTFYQGTNTTFGKIPVILEVHLDIQDSEKKDPHAESPGEWNGRYFLKIKLSAGSDKMYAVHDIGHFLDAFENRCQYHFGKNFIFEPEKMYFTKCDRRILEFLCNIKLRRTYHQTGQQMLLRTNEIIFQEDESERLLEFIWEDIKEIRLYGQPLPLVFENDINLKLKVEKHGTNSLMNVDYSQYGEFEPLTVNFKYIYFKDKHLIAKLPEEKRELIKNMYPFKNKENLVRFKIGTKEMHFFRKNFLDLYGDHLHISMDKKVKEEIKENQLLTKVYFDLAEKGIVSKIEFCYGEKAINPLDELHTDKSFREIDSENQVLAQMKAYGFKEWKQLFLLNDVAGIMFLLTDKLTELKKIAEIYYSVDFKKLYVKDLDSFGLSLSEDESVIHMNINLENITDEELEELLKAIKTGKKYYRLKNGSIINLASVESSKFVSLINSLDIHKESIHDGIFEIPLNRCLYIEQYLKEKNVENVTIDSKLGCLMNKITNPNGMELDLNNHLKHVLRSYQLTGVKWLQMMADYSFGGVLADDMGLGKTLQVLAFITIQKHKQTSGKLPCIVVAPTSVLYNWKSEAEKFIPELKVLVVTGLKNKRLLLLNKSNEYDLIITSYGALKHDIDSYRNANFLYIFLDEAQNIKNPETLNANSVKSLKGKCAFALTGTPIENRLMELWSIFDFIMPGLLFDRTKFLRTYEEPIAKEKNSKKTEELSRIIKPFIIRRLKKDVLRELPEKIETNSITELKEEQKKLYAAFYKNIKKELIPKIEESGIARNQMEIFSALTRLRQICAHPGMFLEDYDGGSTKLDAAMEIIHKSIESGHSILLFSQFTKMLKIIRSELERRNVNWYYLDGTMKPEERMLEIENFNADQESVFLLSLKAAGTGINLTKADVVIHFDPWWNPATENQASDRAHRIGQKNVVQVYNLLTEGTIEEKIAQLKERKKNLMESLIEPGENFLNQLGENEIRGLFNLPSEF